MKKTYKIAVIVDQLVAGGVQKAAIEEAYYLNKLGFKTKILSLSKHGYEKDIFVKKVEYEFLENRFHKFLRVDFKFPIFHFFSSIHLISPIIAPHKIKKGEFDLVIAHNAISGLTALTINKISHIPYFLTVHDPAIFIMDKIYKKTFLGILFPIIIPIIKTIEKKVFKNAKIVFTDSNVYKKFLLEKYQIKSQTLYLGIEPQENPVSLGRDFISLSRWDLAKNPKLILDIAENFKNRRFIIAGKWTNEQELNKFTLQIKNRKLTKQIVFINNANNKKGLFENKLAFIHPHFEAFGLGALEAASYGLPVIIPEKSGVTEILQNKTEGLYPHKATENQFIKSIELLIQNPQVAEKIGRDLFLKTHNYTWENHANQLRLYLQKTLVKQIKTAILETGHINLQFLAGGDIILQKLIESLSNKIKITVITTKFGALHWKKNIKKFEIQTLSRFEAEANNQIAIFLLYVKRSLKSFTLLKQIKPQLIISTTDIFPDVLPATFYKLTSHKTKWIAWVHHLIPPPTKRKGNFITNLTSYLLQLVSLTAIRISADIIICRNSTIYDQLKQYGFNTLKLRTIATGVDFHKINNHIISRKYNYDGVFIGRLNLLKGILDIPAIWQKVTRQVPNAKLAIIGSTNTKEAQLLQRKLTDYKLNNNVKIMGTVPETELLDILKCSKVFLMTDYEAGFSLATSEAMAAGVPVIAYDLPIFGAIYKKGYISTKAGDTSQMAEGIVKLLKNPPLRKKLSNECLSEAKKLDISKTKQAFGRIVNEIT